MTLDIRNKIIIKNTIMLYIRMFFIMSISLYTSRIVLEALGVDDFGIYNVVGGLVSAFSLLTSSLSSIGARFINFNLGKNDCESVREVVSNSVNIQIYLSFIVLIFCETFGLWFLNNELKIPADRLYAANWVFQLSLLTFIVKLISVPYNSLIIAHEHMSMFAYLSILEVCLQLGLIYLLLVVHSDRLILYAALLLFISITVTAIYYIYCKKKFDECCYKVKLNIPLFKEMASYAGWNFIGTASGVFRNQGVDIIVNIFFGVTINAARGIANQVNTAVTKFSQNFVTAINPQITQTYASEDWPRFHMLISQGALMSYYLLWIICVPLFFEMNTVLNIWLTDVPPDSVQFSQLQLIISLIAILSNTNITAMLATGRIKWYQIIVGTVSLLNFPLSYIILRCGYSASSTYIVAIVIEILCMIARLLVSRRLIHISLTKFVKEVILRALAVSAISLIVPIIIVSTTQADIKRLIITALLATFWNIIVIYAIGVDGNKRKQIKSIMMNRIAATR